MKTTLVFNEDEHIELDQALLGSSLSIIIWELDQWLRSEQKYHQRESIDTTELREKIRDLLNEHGVTFEHKIFS